MRGLLIGILVLALVVIGGGLVAATAYQAGVTAAAVATTTEGAAVVAPVVVHGYGWGGWGWGPGFGFFGFFGFLLVLFLVFGLIRAIAGPRRGWGGPGRWDGPNGGRLRQPVGVAGEAALRRLAPRVASGRDDPARAAGATDGLTEWRTTMRHGCPRS